MKENIEQSPRNFRDTNQWANICIMVSQYEKRDIKGNNTDFK